MTQRRGRWRWVVGLLVALAVGRGMAGLVAGAAQADALGIRPSWRLLTAMDLSLRVLVAAVAALVLFANLLAVRHSIVSVVLPRQLGNLRFGEAVPMRLLTLGAAAFALAIGALFAFVDLDGRQVLLALHGVRFGATDPYLERDLGWYLVGLPVEQALWETGGLLLAAAAVLTIALYAGTPSLRVRDGRLTATGWVRRHLGVVGAVGLLFLAWHWRLERYELLLTGRGAASGFGAVEHRLILPYLLGLTMLGVGGAGIFLTAIWRGALRVGAGVLVVLLILAPVGRIGLATFGPTFGSTVRAISDREVPYQATRARFTERAHGPARDPAAAGAAALDSLRRMAPPGAIILPEGGRYRVVRDTTGRVAAPSLTTRRQRIVHAWALQNPRLLWAGGTPEDRVLLGADPWARVARVAPFVRAAPIPRVVTHDGTTYWVLDLAIEAASYPLATPLADRAEVVRYRREAGVALVDAMTGAVHVIPPADPDPVLRAWMALVPDVFASARALPAGLDLASGSAPSPAPETVPATAGRPDAITGPASDLRSQAGALYEAMETARRAGDWAAYGDAWRRLGILLGRAP
ncbi:MAG: hypothetical protein RLZZ25_21 [Gemmatimonadota bacterium]